ncbi:MAG: hypothetical protein ABIA75_06155 [Candidatus Neomarinimicrobiota bacterium]
MTVIGLLAAQSPEIIPLSSKVGTTIDAEENLLYAIFPEIQGFESAQFFQVKEDLYQARIIFHKDGQVITNKKFYTWKEYIDLKHQIDRMAPITDQDRQNLYQDLTYLRTREILDDIPTGQFVKVKHVGGMTVRGILVPHGNDLFRIQTPVQIVAFPYHEVGAISYRSVIVEQHHRRKWLYVVGAGLGLGLSEVWNSQTAQPSSQAWHNRFLGSMLGLMLGQELYEAANILLSPRTAVAIATHNR